MPRARDALQESCVRHGRGAEMTAPKPSMKWTKEELQQAVEDLRAFVAEGRTFPREADRGDNSKQSAALILSYMEWARDMFVYALPVMAEVADAPVPEARRVEKREVEEMRDQINACAALLKVDPCYLKAGIVGLLSRAEAAEKRVPEALISDPGTEKLLRTLLDRIYKMNLMAIPSLRVGEQDQDSNDPLVAWMSDARLMLYGSGQKPDVMRDLQGTPSPLVEKNP